jgi:choline dehydrogenase
MLQRPNPLANRRRQAAANKIFVSLPKILAQATFVQAIPMTTGSAEMLTRFNPPAGSWSMFAGIVRPQSRGRIRLTGPNPLDPVQIETNTISHPDDLKAAIACVQLCREIGNSAALRQFTKREVMAKIRELFHDSERRGQHNLPQRRPRH